MQLTIKRDIQFLGTKRKVGDVVDVEIGNGVGQITHRALAGLVNGGVIEAPGMAPAGNSGMETHLRAKVEHLEGTVKKQASALAVTQQAYDDLAARVALLEGGAKPAKTRREARAGEKQE